MHHRLPSIALWATVFLAASSTLAAHTPAAVEEALSTLPPALRPWVDAQLPPSWTSACIQPADRNGGPLCSFPSLLSLDLKEGRGAFSLTVFNEEDVQVRLPGDKERWPLQVTDGPKPVVVMEQGEEPVVQLSKGLHVLKGVFLWDHPPEYIQVPKRVGRVALTMKGKAVPFVVVDDDGKVWLQKRVQEAKEKNALSLTVHRNLHDGAVAEQEVRMELQVSGESREVTLGPVFDKAWVPLRLTSGLPARVDDDNKLTVQLRAGTHELTVVARHVGPLQEVVFQKPKDDAWPDSEVWVFAAAPSVRQVRVEDGVGIDPAQTRLPSSWKSLPAFLLQDGQKLRFVQERRGDEHPTPDRLELARTLWLDFDGTGVTFDDEMRGVVHRSRRLQMAPSTTLGQVTFGGAYGQDQFITVLDDAKDGKGVGVEVRGQELNVRATARYEGSLQTVPAVSWDHDFHSVKQKLHLPPGFRLLHVSGVDDVSDTWLKRWTLLELFLLLVTTLVTARLFGAPWAVLCFLTLGLIIPESDAPRWIFLSVLAVEALARVLQKGIPSYVVRGLRAFVLLLFVLMALPFAVHQVRVGMYPSLKRPDQSMSSFQDARAVSQWTSSSYNKRRPSGSAGGLMSFSADEAKSEAPPPPVAQKRRPKKKRKKRSLDDALQQEMDIANLDGAFGNIGNVSNSLNAQKQLAQFDPGAQVQTGPGLPMWTWDSVHLTFSGPVKKDQTLAFYVATPVHNFIFGFLRAILLLLMTLCFLRLPGKRWPAFLKSKIPPELPMLAVPLLVLSTSTGAHAADAAFPSQALIDKGVKQVEERLKSSSTCKQGCVSLGQMRLTARDAQLSIDLDVDAWEEQALRLPGRNAAWSLQEVLIDGRPTQRFVRITNGDALRVVVPKGRHVVTLRARLPNVQTVQVPLPILGPHHVVTDLKGWTTDSVHEDGKADSVVTLERSKNEVQGAATFESGALPGFVVVERQLRLGLVWQVDTVVRRRSPAGESVAFDLPLLPHEKVLTEGIRVEQKAVKVHLGPRDHVVRFSSLLEEKPVVELVAPDDKAAYAERWSVEVSPLWHLEEEGIPPLLSEAQSSARSYAPWPKEKLTLRLSRPKGTRGQTLTVDKARLLLQPGVRATDATLTVKLRASRGDAHAFTLPKGAEVSSLKVANKPHPIRVKEGQLRFSTTPGPQTVEVKWRTPTGMDTVFKTPKLDLGAKGANAEVVVKVPHDRWTLFVWGPKLGPAVLFWSLLFAVLVVAIGLSRLLESPLKLMHWLLLGLGMSQVPLIVPTMVAGWIAVVSWRERKVELQPHLFAMRQLLVVASTMVAMMCLAGAIYGGLLGDPDMQIQGNGSTRSTLNWMQDRIMGAMPDVRVVSVPLFAFRVFMLLWALWLAASVVRWLKWTWTAFQTGGMWRDFPASQKASGGAAAPTSRSTSTDASDAPPTVSADPQPPAEEGAPTPPTTSAAGASSDPAPDEDLDER